MNFQLSPTTISINLSFCWVSSFSSFVAEFDHSICSFVNLSDRLSGICDSMLSFRYRFLVS